MSAVNIGAIVAGAMLAVPSDLKASVTFSRTVQTQAASTGQLTQVMTSVKGTALQVKDDQHRFERLGLSIAGHTTLFFTPTTLGQCPRAGDTLTWAGVSCSVEGVEPIAPAGTVVGAYLVISR